jgi:hypothetical protein
MIRVPCMRDYVTCFRRTIMRWQILILKTRVLFFPLNIFDCSSAKALALAPIFSFFFPAYVAITFRYDCSYHQRTDPDSVDSKHVFIAFHPI